MGFRLREQLKVIWDAFVGNTAWSVLTVIVGSSSVALCLETSRAWLFRKHAITLEGWSLVGAILLCLSGIVLPTRRLVLKVRAEKGWKYANREDVEMTMESHLNRLRSAPLGRPYMDFRVDYNNLDKHLLLKPGSTQRYLPGVIGKLKHWETIRQGARMVDIRYVCPREEQEAT
jgi:hypothetical protein